MNKIIFLDIDGVLNHDNWYISEEYSKLSQEDELDIDPKCIERINSICRECDAKIVVSSDWRFAFGWKSRLERVGLENILDCTPITLFGAYGPMYHFSRGEEVQMWLEWYPQYKKYIIIDDRTDFTQEQIRHFIKIDPHVGLTDEDTILAMHMLNS